MVSNLKNLQIGPNFWLNFSKVHHFFLWVDTENLNIVEESSISLVSKTTLQKILQSGFHVTLVRFSSHFLKTWPVWLENLTKIFLFRWFYILDILRIQSLILDFPYLLTKKSTALLKKLCLKLDQFGGSLGLKPLCLRNWCFSCSNSGDLLIQWCLCRCWL